MRETSSTVFFLYTGEVETDDAKYTRDLSLRKLNPEQRVRLVSCFDTAYFIAKKNYHFLIIPI